MGTALFAVEQLRAIETAAQVSLPAGELMRRAGTAAAVLIDRRCARKASVLIVCGPGNNGGDGYACATELAQRGLRVDCLALAEPATDDARAERQRWLDSGGSVRSELPSHQEHDLIVDAMFGIGMTRPLAGHWLAAARWMADRSRPVVALDVPSGLDADRGGWVGGVAGVLATETITFLGAKPGLFTHHGVDAAGRVTVDDLGIAAGASKGTLLASEDFAPALVSRARNSHKGTYGNVLVVGGNVGMVGAALIAARAALRLGAGRVFVDCIGAPELRVDPTQPELMFRHLEEITDLQAIVLGCGLGAGFDAETAMRQTLDMPLPIVIDADALNLLAADSALRVTLRSRPSPRVLTPHPLEAARLLGRPVADVQADRLAAARTLAEADGAIVVLKGAGTVIAEPGGTYWINTTGSPALATAGTGDALAGMIGALIVQSTVPAVAARAAVWLHGAAADEFEDELGLTASDIAPHAARILSRLRRGHAVR